MLRCVSCSKEEPSTHLTAGFLQRSLCRSFHLHSAAPPTSHCWPKHLPLSWQTLKSEVFQKRLYCYLGCIPWLLNGLSPNEDVVFFNGSSAVPLPTEQLKKYHLSELNFFLYNENILFPLLKLLTLWPRTIITPCSPQHLCWERERSLIFFNRCLKLTMTMSFPSVKKRGNSGVLLYFSRNSYLVITFTYLMRTAVLWILYISYWNLTAVNFSSFCISFFFIWRALDHAMFWIESKRLIISLMKCLWSAWLFGLCLFHFSPFICSLSFWYVSPSSDDKMAPVFE